MGDARAGGRAHGVAQQPQPNYLERADMSHLLNLTSLSDPEFVAGAGVHELATNPELPGGQFHRILTTQRVERDVAPPPPEQAVHVLHRSPDCRLGVDGFQPVVEQLAGAHVKVGMGVSFCALCGPGLSRSDSAYEQQWLAPAVGSVVAADVVLTELEKAAAPGGAWHSGPPETIMKDWAELFLAAARLVGKHPCVPQVASVNVHRLLERLTDGGPFSVSADTTAVAAWMQGKLPSLESRWDTVTAAWPMLRVAGVDQRWAQHQRPFLVAVRRSSVASSKLGFSKLPDLGLSQFPGTGAEASVLPLLLSAPVLAVSDTLALLTVPEAVAHTLDRGVRSLGSIGLPKVMPAACAQVALAMLEHREWEPNIIRRIKLDTAMKAAVAATRGS